MKNGKNQGTQTTGKTKTMKYLALLTIFSVLACTSPSSPEQEGKREKKENPAQQAFQQALQTHDEIMPMTGELNRLGRELKSRIEQCPPKQKSSWQAAIDSLESTEDAMMQWMAAFPSPTSLPDSLNEEQIRQLYRQKEREIVAIGKRMKAARDRANELLEN